ncbi:MAG: hypothetical protein CM1200mP30_03820 [Pseudomonadota bacterium]|nr:MAG: hypothetical protein CM1200mP30_03820 [Pseudomonadota bacterium]
MLGVGKLVASEIMGNQAGCLNRFVSRFEEGNHPVQTALFPWS